ncbi:unnamed protein product [Adineta steineri]|uniref:WWE domain-containing protein n=1 Tax=Adineta steineri TaxID=433720 RepID=A0A814L287_9BILA|nr:unnamed protein product [Adineta steineri]CAF3982474.1 unnamed protein product [Adineta steineri]
MGSGASRTSNSLLKDVEWKWQSNENPFSEESAEWKPYSDLENLIIERALKNKQQRAFLDGHIIDLESNLQVLSTDHSKQRPIKRVIRKRKDTGLRKARFMDSLVGTTHLSGREYVWVSSFIIEVRRHLKLLPDDLPSKNRDLIPDLVEKAAAGIIAEGTKMNKKNEALELALRLREHKHKGIEEVWKCCAYLYTLESFLYEKLHEVMVSVGDKNKEQFWRSKLDTLGPFCLLLWDDPINTKLTTRKTLYHAAKLEPKEIDKYKDMIKDGKNYGSFQAYISCSRNRAKVEKLGNTLFIIEVFVAFTANLSSLSEYPKEEEELITPGVCFHVKTVTSVVVGVDNDDGKPKISKDANDHADVPKKLEDAYDRRNAVNIVGTYIDNDYADAPAHDNRARNAHISIRVDRRRIIQAAMMYDRDGYVIDKKKSGNRNDEYGKISTKS